MASSSLPSLPKDVIVEILYQLKRSSDTAQDLTSCLLVSRCWQEAATPLLYGNVVLTHSNMARFCEHQGLGRVAVHVHSVTISLQPYEDLAPIQQLPPLLSQLSNLRSFSFWLAKGSYAIIPQSILVQLVDALPSSCTNLELDTTGDDAREEDVTHMCDSLRRILPRMQHVRLRIRSCEALFTDPSTPDQPIRLPHLKSFVYACARSGTPLPTCRHPLESPITHGHDKLLWTAVTSSLKKLVASPNAIPTDSQVYAFMTTDRNDNDLSLWPAHIRADMRSQTSHALPYRAVWMEAMIRGSYVLRLPDGAEVMGTPVEIEAVAEGQLWRDVLGGARLPAAVLADAHVGKASFAVGCAEKPMGLLKSSEQWREENPNKKIMTWVNEKNLGMKLVSAEVRRGKDKYLSLEMVKEVTPEGWVRVGMNDVLEKAGT